MSKKILITGGSGMIGYAMNFGIKPKSTELNIIDEKSINKFIDTIGSLDVIIHLAALNLRECEQNPLQAIKVNIDGTINMLKIAKKYDIPFVFLSTGAVFSSTESTTIFTENTPMNPNCIYGNTKKTAEDVVKMYNKSIIIRTGWLFGGLQKPHYKFVEHVIDSLLTNKIVKGSDDFVGSPTYVYDLIKKIQYLVNNNKYGVYHVVNSDYANGYEIAVEIAKNIQKPSILIEHVSANKVPNATSFRSKSECLSTQYDYLMLRSWKEALKEYIQYYISQKNTIFIDNTQFKKLEYEHRKVCRLCNSDKLYTFFSLEHTPPANHFISIKTQQQSLPINLSICKSCNHIQLLEIIEPSYLYSQYLYLSSISQTMSLHLKKSINNFINRFNIGFKDYILEIGSNDGTCIQELLNLGYLNTIGVDPAQNINKMHNLPIICDYFGLNILNNETIKNKKFKLIFGFHCCAHIEKIQEVFQTVYKLLDDEGIFIIEVGYFNEVIKQNNFDVIYHEHIDYHTCYTMNNFAKLKNMYVFDVLKNNIQSGSIQFFMCKRECLREITDNVKILIQEEISNRIFDIEFLNSWKNNIINLTEEFNNLICGLHIKGKKIAGYGASAKSTTFLHQCKMNNKIIKYIIDDNTLKQNKYSSGLHIPIYSKEFLNIEPVDYIIILSWNFTDEIIKSLKPYIKNQMRIIVPFPNFRIY